MGEIESYWKNKKVLVTGHTGFKGMWLSIFLVRMGARVIGVSNSDLAEKHLYNSIDGKRVFDADKFIDIRDRDRIGDFIADANPEIIFHLAAQPLVSASYIDPIETFETNIMGTVNVLEGARRATNIDKIICVTSDKCYQNTEQIWSYREGDPMGGDDPYSASKGAAEIVAHSMWKSFLKENQVSMATVRAGNVIGGGDYSKDRIITDILNAYSNDTKLILRNPNATRPWQHVLEPVFAYMLLVSEHLERHSSSFSSFNVGPDVGNVKTVKNLADAIGNKWGKVIDLEISTSRPFHEAMLLSVDNAKIKHETSWKPRWAFKKTVEKTLDWYQHFNEGHDAFELCNADLLDYLETV